MGEPLYRLKIFLFRLPAVEYQFNAACCTFGFNRESHLQVTHSARNKGVEIATLVLANVSKDVDVWNQRNKLVPNFYSFAKVPCIYTFTSFGELGAFLCETDSRSRWGFVPKDF